MFIFLLTENDFLWHDIDVSPLRLAITMGKNDVLERLIYKIESLINLYIYKFNF